MTALLPLFIAVPFGMAVMVFLLSRKWTALADALAVLTLAALLGMALAAVGKAGVYAMGGWDAPLGITLRLDGLSVLLLLVINGIGFCSSLFSIRYLDKYTSKRRFYSLFLCLVTGMNGVVLSGDLFNLYVFMELAAVSSYALVGFGGEHEELEASFRYFVLGSVASAFILIGIAVVYGMTGTLSMAGLASGVGGAVPDLPLAFALVLFVCGFGLKAALVPFHSWLADAHSSAPAPISSMLSGVVIKGLGLYVMARLIFNVFGASEGVLLTVRVLGALSMIVGVLLAIGQWDMKRLFAYHSISQIGYVALGVGLGTPLGVAGGLYHLVNHSAFKSLLFLNAGAVEYSTGTRDLKRLGGLSRALPVSGATSLVASMSIAGVPPFNGFWSKLIIIIACVAAGHLWLAVAAVFVSVMTLASFLKVQKYGYFETLKIAVSEIRRTPFTMAAAMVILALLCAGLSLLVIGGFSSPFLIGPAAEVLMKGVAP